MYVIETYLNPNVSGNSANSLFNKVLFPEPDGPQTTSGRGPCFTIFPELTKAATIKNYFKRNQWVIILLRFNFNFSFSFSL